MPPAPRALEAEVGAKSSSEPGVAEEASLALESMGLAPERARAAVDAVLAEERHEDVESFLRAALRRVKPPA